VVDDSGWRPLQRPVRPADPHLGVSPFGRLAATHALSVAGDTLLTIALAGSLFFSVRPDAARGRVAAYLALTMAPFAVVGPLLGPVLDRTRGGRRLMVVASTAGRAVACFMMAGDVNSLFLYPEAFAFLVLSKSYFIARSALVPAAVVNADELVEANAKLQLLGVVAGVVASGPGALLLKTLGATATLYLATAVFVMATVAAARIRPAPARATAEGAAARAELRAGGIVLAASAMGLLRGVVGFSTFLIAFGFRRDHAPSWWFGIVLAAGMAGTLLGALVAPRLRESFREERILAGALIVVVATGLVATRGASVRMWAAILAAAVALAAATGKLAFDSLVQRDAPDAARGRSFARFETRFQLIWVAGAFIPVVVPIPLRIGFAVVAAAAAFGAFSYLGGTQAVQRYRRTGAGRRR
jgi:hypothetical protein